MPWMFRTRGCRFGAKEFKAEAGKEDAAHSGATKNDDVIAALAEAR